MYPLQWRQLLFVLLSILGNENGVVGQDIFFDAFKCFQVTGKEPRNWITIIEVEQSYAEGSSNVLENFDCVRGRLVLYLLLLDEAVLIYL